MAPAIPLEYSGQKEYQHYSFSEIMGKSRKYSKGGNSSGFVPDYRHVVETMGESEGFGSSVRVDMGLTASEYSCAPKRKCISLNADSYDNFGVPTQVFSLSKMSQPERKDLELRLKVELEQVQTLQKKVASLGSNVVVSQSTDNRKKRPFGGQNGAQPKKSKSTRVDSVQPALSVSNSKSHLIKQCDSLLNRLMQHNFGWVFNTPVDVVKLNIPDYFTVIKHPMDLGTVKNKLASGHYSSLLDFATDVRLTFSNALTYNPPGNDVHFMAETLNKMFETRWKAIEQKLPVAMNVDVVPSAAVAMEVETNNLPLKKKKLNSKETIIKSEPVRQIMSDQEKQTLSAELESLLGELPENIVNFLKEQSSTKGQAGEEEVEIEVDIDALSDETLFKLRKLLDDYLLEKEKNHPRAEACEMELHNEPGFSNSSIQPGRGNDQVEEDIDIVGGNDPHSSSYPQVEVEKDLTHRNSRCSSPSGSSSKSGSSSSDSDSGSSSGSEADAGKASVPAGSMKEILDSGIKVDLKNGSIAVPEDGNKPLDNLKSHCKSSATEAEGHREEENDHAERQVSPEKLYRAALLRNRFADTILKAREKALEKGEKGDPEKLRMEREELERRQKEEKARLQAEAKAAEEARKKAEAEAAAEAKRTRELEREAARQELLKMEKTVDINENSGFMEDFEMLRTSNDEHLPNFLEETSPGLPQNGLGSFKLQGISNPLEKLGLYMKPDDEDEEDEPLHSAPEPANDATEEGEID